MVDSATAGSLKHLLGDLVEGQGNRAVAVELRRVAALDGSVLELLVSASHQAVARGRRLVVCGPSPAVLAALDRAGLLGALEVSD